MPVKTVQVFLIGVWSEKDVDYLRYACCPGAGEYFLAVLVEIIKIQMCMRLDADQRQAQ